MDGKTAECSGYFVFLGLVLSVLLLGSCSGNSHVSINSPNGTVVIQSPVERDTSPAVQDSELKELVEGNTSFALDLYHSLRTENGNIFFSPYSISSALAMTYAGAEGDTQQGMGATLRFTLPQNRLHPAFDALDLELAKRGTNAQGQDGKGFRLRVANSVWGQAGYTFLQEYLDILARDYGAGLTLLDFRRDPDGSRITINEWVSDKTEEKIKDLLPPGAIDTSTRLVLTNAVYFNAAWANPFKKEFTHADTFHLIDGNATSVDMMSQTGYFGHGQGNDYDAVELPYDGGELAMVIIVPKEGYFDEFEGSLDSNRLSDVLGSIHNAYVMVNMPRFSYKGDAFSLREILSSMGMSSAFDPDLADFSGMTGKRDLHISDIFHRAFLTVNEDGTEAAAATAVVIGVTAIPAEPVTMSIDRPFIFLIRDIKTAAVLFMGRVMDPTK